MILHVYQDEIEKIEICEQQAQLEERFPKGAIQLILKLLHHDRYCSPGWQKTGERGSGAPMK